MLSKTGHQLDINNSIFDFNFNNNNNPNVTQQQQQQWNYWQSFPCNNNSNVNKSDIVMNSQLQQQQKSQHQEQQNIAWASFPNSCNNIAQSVSSPPPPPESNRWSKSPLRKSKLTLISPIYSVVISVLSL